MQLVGAVVVLACTIALVLGRPNIGRFGRLHPAVAAAAGAFALTVMGLLGADDLVNAFHDLWKPLVTVASVMMTTSAAHRMGIFDRVARSIEIRTRGPVTHGFTTVFIISSATATVFNNDAAILLLTPIVIPLIRRLYPRRGPVLSEPFGFAVFVAAGVAALSTSNPMNLVVAERAGLAFNGYALRMIPVALTAAVASYYGLRRAYRKVLDDPLRAGGPEQGSLAPMEGEPVLALVIVVGVLASYPFISYFGQPVWIAALTGAVLTVLLGLRHGSIKVQQIPGGVAWDVLAFLFAIFMVATGLRNAGLLDALVAIHRLGGSNLGGQLVSVSVSSALGSALLNNHPMAALNALAIDRVPEDRTWRLLAALVGGDLGPRLLPMGSLAGLLWLDMLQRMDVVVSARTFIRVGLYTTLPALAVSIAMLWLETRLIP